MVISVKHASLTGAAADPTAMVDGPKWDEEHTVTGLENVDNTADADKPVSTATQTALDLKRNVSTSRELITAARTYYVRADGSDSNTGLVDNAGGAFLTIQKLIDTISNIDMGPYQVTGQVRSGTYTAGNSLKTWTGSLPPIIIGDETTPSNVIVHPTGASCFLNDGAHPWHIRGFQLDSTTSGSQLRITNGGVIYFKSCDFAASAGNHIFADGGGSSVVATGNYSISGSPGGDGIHILIADGASGKTEGATVTVTNTPNWAGAYASVSRNGSYRAVSMAFVGSATGARRAVSSGGVIYTGGGGDSYFPGNSTGTGTNSATSPYGNYI
jgi:hypothetical protein